MEDWNPFVPELTVTSLSTSLEFYRALGATVRFERTDPPFAYLDLPGGLRPSTQLMLEQDAGSSWLRGPLEWPFGRGVNFQWEVGSVHETLSNLAAAGFYPFREARDTWYSVGDGKPEEGQREVLVCDPDGYVWRLTEVLAPRSE